MKLTRVEIAALASLTLLFGSSLFVGCQPKSPAVPNDAPVEPATAPQATPTETPAAAAQATPSAETTAKSENYQVTGGFRAGVNQ
jgi:hypothetical protein